MNSVIEKAKQLFLQMITDFDADPYHLKSHVPEMEKWAKFMLTKNPEADETVVLLAVWLHDLGHYPVPTEIDHAVRSEERAQEFLQKENLSVEQTKNTLHCIRAHRCRDVMPETLEAKIVACVDSASHMTDFVYLDMAKEDKIKGLDMNRVYEKIDRDFRDLSIFPEIKEELSNIHYTWKKLIESYGKINLK
jgi:hypothetical protein